MRRKKISIKLVFLNAGINIGLGTRSIIFVGLGAKTLEAVDDFHKKKSVL